MCASQVLYELGELDQVEAYLTRCAAQSVKFGSAEAQVFALSGLAHTSLARDDLAAAVSYTGQADALLQAQPVTKSIMAYVEYYRFQLLLKQGNLAAAAAWVESHATQPEPLNPYAFHRLALPQILIARGSFDVALDNLTTLIQEAQDTGHGNLLIKGLVLQALAFHMCGNNSQALTTLERALTLAEPEGYVRIFVDLGAPMAALLHQAHERGIARSYVEKLLDTISSELRVLSFELEAGQRSTQNSKLSTQNSLVEPLTARELEVLQLLADGASNDEIARRLIISLGTVKKHLSNIFGKLEAQNRTRAVARARALDLL